MRIDNEGNKVTLEQDIAALWKSHGLNVKLITVKSKSKYPVWMITATQLSGGSHNGTSI